MGKKLRELIFGVPPPTGGLAIGTAANPLPAIAQQPLWSASSLMPFAGSMAAVPPGMPTSMEPQAPTGFAVDTSLSTRDIRRELEAGIDRFLTELKGDKLASARVWLRGSVFDSTVREIVPFSNVCAIDTIKLPPCDYCTHLYEAFADAVQKVQDEKFRLEAAGFDTYRGMVVVITDGMSTSEPPGARERAKRLIAEAEARQHQFGISTYAVAVGADADRKDLEDLTGRKPLEVDGRSFPALFDWLVKSLTKVATSRLCDNVEIDSFKPVKGE